MESTLVSNSAGIDARSVDQVVKLSGNESPFGPALAVRELLRCAELHRYPDDGAPALCHDLARYLCVDEAEVLVTSGATEAIFLIARVLGGQSSEAVVSISSFVAYELACNLAGMQINLVPTVDYGHDLDAMAQAIGADTRIVFLDNPNNPSGTWLPPERIAQWLRSLPRHVVVVLDEAYLEYAQDPEAVNAVALRDLHPGVIVLRTFSKCHGLAALRVGYAIGPENLIAQLERHRPPFNVNQVAQRAACLALECQDHVREVVSKTRRERERLRCRLENMGLWVSKSHANYLLVELPLPAKQICARLAKIGIAVRQLPRLTHHVRVTVGTAKENESFVRALARTLPPRDSKIPFPEHAARVFEQARSSAAASGEPSPAPKQDSSPPERLSYMFEQGLKQRFVGDDSGLGNLYASMTRPDRMLAAYDALEQSTPLIRTGHMAANLALLRAADTDVIRIVDIGIGSGRQWLDFIERLSRRTGCARKLVLTGIDVPNPGVQERLAQVEARLQRHARARGVALIFEGIASPVEALETLPKQPGRLLVNAALALHHVPDGDAVTTSALSRDAVLRRLAQWKPSVLTLIEPEADHNRTNFLQRVESAWRHYGTVFDLLGELLAHMPEERQTLEMNFFGREICNVVAGRGPERVERHDPFHVWAKRLRALGFEPQTPGQEDVEMLRRDLLAPFDFAIGEGIQLTWRGTPLLSMSVWTPE